MSSSHKPGKEMATSSHKKRARSGNVPFAPVIPKGQTRWFEVKVVSKKRKAWYKKHTEASYFSDVCIDRESLAREFPHILRWIRELGMEFIFTELAECNLHMVREFYSNCAPEGRSHYVTVHGRNVPITTTGINDILAFGGLITKMCRVAGVSEEYLDYMPPLYPASRHRRNDLIMVRMYGLEMLRHQNGYHASTDMQLGEVVRRYPLNDYAKALLGVGPEFHEPIDNDISTDEEYAHTSSDVDSDSEKEIDPTQVGDEAEGVDATED
ncbi:hypothetical protein R3W88_019740 [Solanum pinnatisectum]|uniref:Uncharacterized protein n=1 Tax=Solanum pinnatisectum TaxID=50273 RepID=A0AAV9KLQ2_9SOLN|nr:hypothetical protein R3W88_019740 [Solanum pinnatisectum]